MTTFVNFLTKFKNAIKYNQQILIYQNIPLIYEFCKVLEAHDYFKNLCSIKFNGQKFLIIELNININVYSTKFYITKIQSFCKKKQQLFLKIKNFNKIPKGVKLVVLSTSQGIMSLTKAASLNLGGKILCYIW